MAKSATTASDERNRQRQLEEIADLNPLSKLILKNKGRFVASLGKQRPFDMWLSQAVSWCEIVDLESFRRVSKPAILDAFNAAALNGLLINGEECMVMVRGRKTPKIKCEIGAKGVIRQLGQVGIRVQARTIKENDVIDIDEGTGYVSHKPAFLMGQSPGDTLGFYAVATYPDGNKVVRTMSLEEAIKRSTGTGAWKAWLDQMGEKSAVIALKKVVFVGDDLDNAIAASGAVFGDEWAMREAEQEAAEEPTHPPQSTADKVKAQLARDEQDRDAEGPVEPEGPEEEQPEQEEFDAPLPGKQEPGNLWPDDDPMI